MEFDKWLEFNYETDPNMPKDILIAVLDDKMRYLREVDSRGWSPFAIVGIGNDAWMKLGEIKGEDSFNNVSPTINQWCIDNCTGRWNACNPIWWEIEFEEDALAFKLVWG